MHIIILPLVSTSPSMIVSMSASLNEYFGFMFAAPAKFKFAFVPPTPPSSPFPLRLFFALSSPPLPPPSLLLVSLSTAITFDNTISSSTPPIPPIPPTPPSPIICIFIFNAARADAAAAFAFALFIFFTLILSNILSNSSIT